VLYQTAIPQLEGPMKAVVFHGIGDVRLDNVAEP
jgi:hypothetical protein